MKFVGSRSSIPGDFGQNTSVNRLCEHMYSSTEVISGHKPPTINKEGEGIYLILPLAFVGAIGDGKGVGLFPNLTLRHKAGSPIDKSVPSDC